MVEPSPAAPPSWPRVYTLAANCTGSSGRDPSDALLGNAGVPRDYLACGATGPSLGRVFSDFSSGTMDSEGSEWYFQSVDRKKISKFNKTILKNE